MSSGTGGLGANLSNECSLCGYTNTKAEVISISRCMNISMGTVNVAQHQSASLSEEKNCVGIIAFCQCAELFCVL